MRFFLIILSLALFCGNIQASNDSSRYTNDIFTTQEYRPGFYRNYEEFLHNSPGVQHEAKVGVRSSGSIGRTGGGFYDIVYLKEPEKDPLYYHAQIKYVIRPFWGYCDGSSIYVLDNQIVKGRTSLSRILLLDHLAAVEHYNINDAEDTYVATAFAFGLVGSAALYTIKGLTSYNKIQRLDSTETDPLKTKGLYILDNGNKGKLLPFSYHSFLEIMYYRDMELYTDFVKLSPAQRIGQLRDYFILFNKRYQEKMASK